MHSVRAIADPFTSFKSFQSVMGCCLYAISDEQLTDLYHYRLEMWSVTQKEQDEKILSLYKLYYNKKTEAFQFLVKGWPLCFACICKLSGVSKKRWLRLRREWRHSGGSTVRMRSAHGTKIRHGPKRDYFFEYLTSVVKV